MTIEFEKPMAFDVTFLCPVLVEVFVPVVFSLVYGGFVFIPVEGLEFDYYFLCCVVWFTFVVLVSSMASFLDEAFEIVRFIFYPSLDFC